MPDFNVESALADGKTPDQIVSYLASQPQSVTGFNFKLAQQDNQPAHQILSHYMQGPPKPVSTSPWAAFRNGAGDFVSGLGNLAKTQGELIGRGNSGAGLAMGKSVTDLGQDVVDAGQALSGPQQYAGHSIGRAYNAFKNGNVGAGAYALAGGVANALPTTAAMLIAPEAAVPAVAASSAGNTVQGRMDSQGQLAPTVGDLGAGMGSAVANLALGPLAHGVAGGLLGKTAGDALGAVANKVIPDAAKPYANLASAATAKTLMGVVAGAANGAAGYAANTLGTGQFTGSGLADAMGEGAGTGGLMGAGIGGAMSGKAVMSRLNQNKVASNVGADALLAHPWNQAVASNFQKIQAQSPQMPFEDAQSAAMDQARASGLTPPLTQDYSPTAQYAARQVTGQKLLANQRVNATTNMGAPDANVTDAQVAQGAADALKQTLQGISSEYVTSGKLNTDGGGILNAAINEASKRNRAVGQSAPEGTDDPYNPQNIATALDRVKQLPLPPEDMSTLLHYIPTLDMLQNNALVKNQVGAWGPRLGLLGSVAGHVAPILGLSSVGGAAGHMLGDPSTGALAGAWLGDKLAPYLTRALNGPPMAPIMKTAPAITAYLARKGLTPDTVIPGSLADLASNVSQAAQDQRDQAAAMAQAAGSAVSKGQAQANTKLANTLGTLGPNHPLGMTAMQQLADNGQHPLIAQSLAKFNALQPLTDAQGAIADANQRQQAAEGLAALQAKQAAAGNKQAVKDQSALADLQGRTAQGNAMAAFSPDSEPLSPIAMGQAQAAKSNAATLGKLGPDHPVGLAAMQQLAANGQHPLIAQALAKFNGVQPVTDAQGAIADAQQRQQAAEGLAALQAKQSAAGNKQAVKDQATIAKLQGRIGQSNALAAFDPDGSGGGAVGGGSSAGAPRMAAPVAPVAPPRGVIDPLARLAQQTRDAVGQQQAVDAANLNNVRQYFPSLGTVWQNRISQNTRVPVADIQDHLQDMVDNGTLPQSEHARLSQSATLPFGEYATLENYIRNQLGTPESGGSQGRSGGSPVQYDGHGLPIRNPSAYEGVVQGAQATHQSILQNHPDLADMANNIHAQQPQADKRALLNVYMMSEKDPVQLARMANVLGPLTMYGFKPKPNP